MAHNRYCTVKSVVTAFLRCYEGKSALGWFMSHYWDNDFSCRTSLCNLKYVSSLVGCVQFRATELHLDYVADNSSFFIRGWIKRLPFFQIWHFLSWRWNQEPLLKCAVRCLCIPRRPCALSIPPLKFVSCKSHVFSGIVFICSLIYGSLHNT
jgi:hypothetical protein